jgi:hypothetical protein
VAVKCYFLLVLDFSRNNLSPKVFSYIHKTQPQWVTMLGCIERNQNHTINPLLLPPSNSQEDICISSGHMHQYLDSYNLYT